MSKKRSGKNSRSSWENCLIGSIVALSLLNCVGAEPPICESSRFSLELKDSFIRNFKKRISPTTEAYVYLTISCKNLTSDQRPVTVADRDDFFFFGFDSDTLLLEKIISRDFTFREDGMISMVVEFDRDQVTYERLAKALEYGSLFYCSLAEYKKKGLSGSCLIRKDDSYQLYEEDETLPDYMQEYFEF